jgi:hypothetical protein
LQKLKFPESTPHLLMSHSFWKRSVNTTLIEGETNIYRLVLAVICFQIVSRNTQSGGLMIDMSAKAGKQKSPDFV